MLIIHTDYIACWG